MQPTKTWILIADAAHARVLETSGREHDLVDVPSMTLHAELPPTHELGSERPTRSHDSKGAARHAIEPKTDAHRELKRDFSELVAGKLEAAMAVRAFSRLVLVCPPVMLGDMRKDISKHLADHIIAEIPKDLVKVSNIDIRAHLDPFVAV